MCMEEGLEAILLSAFERNFSFSRLRFVLYANFARTF